MFIYASSTIDGEKVRGKYFNVNGIKTIKIFHCGILDFSFNINSI